jgi:hypothetical protein
MRKFPKLRYPNHEDTDGLLDGDVVVTEKLDGANFRFTWQDGELHVGTRNHEFHHNDENLPKAFQHTVEYIQNITDGWDFNAGCYNAEEILNGKITFFGEAMHKHSLDYDDIDWEQPNKGSPHVPHDSNYPNVVLFDAYRDGEWVDWAEFIDMVAHSPFQPTEVIEQGDPDDCSFTIPDESMFGGHPEGIVIRRVDGTVRTKKVSDEFDEQKSESSTTVAKTTAESNAAEFVAAYVTEPRIEKNAHKLADNGSYDGLQMEMMEDLPRKVLEDTMAECGWELLNGNFECEWDDEFTGQVRSRASRKCVRVLKSMLQQI